MHQSLRAFIDVKIPPLNENLNTTLTPSNIDTDSLIQAITQEPRPAMDASFLKTEAELLALVKEGKSLTPGKDFMLYQMAQHVKLCKELDAIPEHHLTAEQLDDRYNFNGDGEHPKYSRASWRDEVFNGNTLCGYWVWVRGQVDDAFVHAE